MYLRFTRSKKSKHSTAQIIKGVRIGKKVRQQIVASLGVIKSEKDLINLKIFAENLIRKLEKEGLPIDQRIHFEDLTHKATTYNGFGLIVDKLMNFIGFSNVLQKIQGKKSYDLEEVIKLIIVQRFDTPSSKLRTYERQEDHGFYGIDLHHIYRAMDSIELHSFDMQQKAFETASNFSNEMDCFFFDVTTLYFESVEQNEMKNFGFSKDQKPYCVQIVLALVVDAHGIPICYETFRGNLSETKTLIPVLTSLRKRFCIKKVTVVCDRGMSSKTNVEALQNSKFDFVIATKLRSVSKKHCINDLSKYKELPDQKGASKKDKVLFRVMLHPQYEDADLVVTYSPKRALKDKKDRERFLEKLKIKLKNVSSQSAINKVISNGYKKYINIQPDTSVTINQKALDEDATWDGFHGIAVSHGCGLDPKQALARYRDLWRVEETFRIAKYTLRTRPIFHWTSSRIKSHILLCFMTLVCERVLERLLKQKGFPLTPDKIRYALSQVHTMCFEN